MLPQFGVTQGKLALAWVGISFLALIFWMMPAAEDLVRRWSFQEEYSHGFLLPLVALYLSWERREALGGYWTSGSAWAFPTLILAGLMFAIGKLAALFLFQHLALWLGIFALVLACFGRGVGYLMLPFAILLFAIPLPYLLESALTARLQLWSSELGVALIRLGGVPVFLAGNVIDLGDTQLHVVEACSGLRYLFPLMALGFIVAALYRGRLGFRVALFLSTIPITILMNSLRIAVIGVLHHWRGPTAAEGFMHAFEGWLVFVLCLVLLFAEIWLWESVVDRDKKRWRFATQGMPKTLTRPSKNTTPVLLVSFACLMMLGAYSSAQLQPGERIPASPSLATFPMTLEGYRGARDALAPDVVAGLQFTDYVLADYRAQIEQGSTNFYLAYYASQRSGVSPHSPKVCIPGGGWEIADFSRTTLAGGPVNRAIIRRGDQAQLVYYWFIERGHALANEYVKKWWLLRDVLVHRRSDGALVRVAVPLDSELQALNKAEREAENFIRALRPELARFLPAPPESK